MLGLAVRRNAACEMKKHSIYIHSLHAFGYGGFDSADSVEAFRRISIHL
jgi:hypothetical protein